MLQAQISIIYFFFPLKTAKFNGTDSVMQNIASMTPDSCNKKY